jgi:hypothetical protein
MKDIKKAQSSKLKAQEKFQAKIDLPKRPLRAPCIQRAAARGLWRLALEICLGL